MTLCETNILIHFFNDDPATVAHLDALGREQMALSAITVMELYRGMGNKAELSRMRARINFYDLIHLDEEISRRAVRLLEQFHLSHSLKIPDALIGATAIVTGIPLFTYNTKDFSIMPGLALRQPA